MSSAVLIGVTLGWIVVCVLATGGSVTGLFRRLVERGVLEWGEIDGQSRLIANQRVRLWAKRVGIFLINLGIGATGFFALVTHDPLAATVSGLTTLVGLVVNLLWEAWVVGADLWSEHRYVQLAGHLPRLPQNPITDASALALCEADRIRLQAALDRMTDDRDTLVRRALAAEEPPPEDRPASDTRSA